MVSIRRQFGLAAQFRVRLPGSLASDIQKLDEPSGPAADFTDLHAWAEAYIPGYRLDPGWTRRVGAVGRQATFAGSCAPPRQRGTHPATW